MSERSLYCFEVPQQSNGAGPGGVDVFLPYSSADMLGQERSEEVHEGDNGFKRKRREV